MAPVLPGPTSRPMFQYFLGAQKKPKPNCLAIFVEDLIPEKAGDLAIGKPPAKRNFAREQLGKGHQSLGALDWWCGWGMVETIYPLQERGRQIPSSHRSKPLKGCLNQVGLTSGQTKPLLCFSRRLQRLKSSRIRACRAKQRRRK